MKFNINFIFTKILIITFFSTLANANSFNENLELANRGYARAQSNLGWMYYHGKGIEKDYAKAFEWFIRAANQGSAIDQNNIGEMYEAGEGVTKDYGKAFEWYLKSAHQKNALAQYNLGKLYLNGWGVERDDLKALEWFTLSAKKGESLSQNALGEMYLTGQGVKKDYLTAFDWFLKAANQGNSLAQYKLGEMYETGKGMSQIYAKDYSWSNALEWYKKSANQGNLLAQYRLGEIYYNGTGLEKDYSKALQWFTKSANQGNALAQNKIGEMFESGEGTKKDYSKAIEWYRKAENQGYVFKSNNEKDEVRIIYSNGMYKGQILNRKKHGIGTYFWLNNYRYEGGWKDDEMNGFGKIFDGQNRVTMDGKFSEAKFSGWISNYTSSGDIIMYEVKNHLLQGNENSSTNNRPISKGRKSSNDATWSLYNESSGFELICNNIKYKGKRKPIKVNCRSWDDFTNKLRFAWLMVREQALKDRVFRNLENNCWRPYEQSSKYSEDNHFGRSFRRIYPSPEFLTKTMFASCNHALMFLK